MLSLALVLMPSLQDSELARFPPLYLAQEVRRDLFERQWVMTMRRSMGSFEWERNYEEAERLDTAFRAWDLLYTAQSNHCRKVRCDMLLNLKMILGDEAFYLGFMPFP